MGYDRATECTNSRGGNTELYIFPFIKYSLSEIEYTGNYLTKFPYSAIFKLDSPVTSFNQPVTSEDGGTTFAQNVTFQLNKILDTDDYKNFVDFDWRIIVKDGNGFYRMIGVETGVKGSYTEETGGYAPEYNGFKFTFETKEERTAAFLENLEGFDINGELSLDSILEMLL